jgi:hypothetical protein
MSALIPRDISRVVCEGDQPVRVKRVRIMAMAPAGSHQFTTDLTQTALQLAAIVRRIFAHG